MPRARLSTTSREDPRDSLITSISTFVTLFCHSRDEIEIDMTELLDEE